MKRATVLEELATAAVGRAEDLRTSTDLSALYQEALLFEKRDFAGALSAPGLSVVSEIKRASPSAGFIRETDPAEWGARYQREGASCLSVLTEPQWFRGSLEDLDAARGATTLPNGVCLTNAAVARGGSSGRPASVCPRLCGRGGGDVGCRCG